MTLGEPELLHVPSADGVEVAVHDYGGDGRPALFVHGTGMCARMWEPVMERLVDDGLRMLTIDVRAHGATRTPDDVTFHDHRMVADIVAVIDALSVVDGFAVGHSMGAAATILASLDRPRALDRIWAYEPIIMERGVDELPAEFLDGVRRRRRIYPSRQAAFDRYSTRPPLDELDPATLWGYLDHGFVDLDDGTVMLACDPRQEALAFEQFLLDGFSRLPDVTASVLVAYGGADTESRAATEAPRIAAAMSNGEAEQFPGCSHFGAFADLDHTARSIRRFLKLV